MRDEVTGKRPSVLRGVFRKHTAAGEALADWTRHLDVDWTWYCPVCARVVLLVEEKQENALQTVWNVTRRLATHHEDRPWAWRVTCHEEGEFSVTGARNVGPHESFGDRRITESELISWIVRVFEQHYSEQKHPKRIAA